MKAKNERHAFKLLMIAIEYYERQGDNMEDPIEIPLPCEIKNAIQSYLKEEEVIKDE